MYIIPITHNVFLQRANLLQKLHRARYKRMLAFTTQNLMCTIKQTTKKPYTRSLKEIIDFLHTINPSLYIHILQHIERNDKSASSSRLTPLCVLQALFRTYECVRVCVYV